MDEAELRVALVDAARVTVAAGLNRGTSGNVSVRCGADFLITPSGMSLAELAPAQVVRVSMDGESNSALAPSSEWRIHRDLYQARAEVGAVVHAHSAFAVSLACLRRGLPAFHYMLAAAGGKDIRCADYAIFGSQALSDRILEAMAGRRACLMANHGQVAVGADLARAVDLALEVEGLCEQYWRASLLGEPVLLTDAEMDAVIEKFRDYGQSGK